MTVSATRMIGPSARSGPAATAAPLSQPPFSVSLTTSVSTGPGLTPETNPMPAPSMKKVSTRSVEDQDLPRDLSSLHGPKRLVEVLQRHAPCDHLVQLQSALHVEVHVLGHVHLEVVGAHARTLNLLLAQEDAALELDLLSHRDHADNGRRAAGANRLEALLSGALQADRLERVLHPTLGQLTDLLDGVFVGAVDGVGRAQLVGGLELVVVHVDGDDHACPGDPRALDGR